MGLSRTIPLKRYVFDVASLAHLLRQLSNEYVPSQERRVFAFYLLRLSPDQYTTTSIDEPPRDFEALLNTQLQYVSLKTTSDDPQRNIELTLYHGSNPVINSIRIDGEENWVNLTYTKVENALRRVNPQSDVLARNAFWILPFLTLGIGWVIDKMISYLLYYFGQAKLVPWSWSLFLQHLFLSAIFGVLPAAWLLVYAREAYPDIEIQTGPRHLWVEAKRRARMRIILSVALAGPAVNALYDLYKALISA